MTGLLSVRGLTLDLAVEGGTRRILSEVDLDVAESEAVGIVGESGSGKSMTLRSIARLLPPQAQVSGSISYAGADVQQFSPARLRDYRGSQVGFVFQDPRAHINPLQRVGSFITEALEAAGTPRVSARQKATDLLAAVGIDDPSRRMRQFPFELSGGMLQRVMIASVLLVSPRLILADEPTTALDVTTQSDVLAMTDQLRRERALAMVFVTHDLDLALAVCDRIVVLYAGTVVETATVAEIRAGGGHPYTTALLAARPPLDRRVTPLPTVEGRPVSAYEAGSGCPFAERCPEVMPVCRSEPPPLVTIGERLVRCHLAGG